MVLASLGGLAVCAPLASAGCAHTDAPTDSATATSPQSAESSVASGDAQVDTLQIAPPPDAGVAQVIAASAPTTSASPASPPAGQRPTAAGSSADDSLDPAIFACHADADCAAVKKNGCCNHGELEAVGSTQVAAYKASFTCRTHMMCPQFLRRDLRVPVCDGATSRCQMVAPKP